MLGRLPDRIEPFVLAEAGRRFSGEIPLTGFHRLASALANQEGTMTVELEFGTDEARTPYLAGRVKGEVSLLCQRCLDDMAFPVDVGFRLGLVNGEDEAGRLPEHYEPMLVAPEPMTVADMVEDEIILALPIVPLHVPPHPCAEQAVGDNAQPEETEKENPFAVLAQLKRGSETDQE